MTEFKYSDLSYIITKKINKTEKKNNGIYFTPPKTINKNLELLEPYMENINEILEPSCGSCEYISALMNKYHDKNITGIELNTTIFENILFLQNDNIKLYNENFITYEPNKKFDLIIGNPPYFIMKKNEVNKSYYNYFEGRPNIFILFVIKSLKLLNTNGILSFVLPKNFLNCLYYDKTRKYINENFHILNLFECNDDYIETEQETIVIILQNKKQENNCYCLEIENFTIFGIPENIVKLKSLYNNSCSLTSLGFNVCVGNVVWNQCKDILTADNKKTLLVYSSDIKNNKLIIKKYSNEEKKNYINKKGSTEPLLVINRGYGVGKYSFNYCLINENENIEYLIENHLICIKYTKSISNEKLISLYKKIIKSFENKNTQEFIELYFGNNAINTTELCNMLPIYDI
jgi:type I restriction-modification system DNA methylase subunit